MIASEGSIGGRPALGYAITEEGVRPHHVAIGDRRIRLIRDRFYGGVPILANRKISLCCSVHGKSPDRCWCPSKRTTAGKTANLLRATPGVSADWRSRLARSLFGNGAIRKWAIGVTQSLDITEVPDDSLEPETGSHRHTATALRHRNRNERRREQDFLCLTTSSDGNRSAFSVDGVVQALLRVSVILR